MIVGPETVTASSTRLVRANASPQLAAPTEADRGTMAVSAFIQRAGRALGLGRALLRMRQVKLLGVHRYTELLIARSRILPRIREARPIAADAGVVDVHMLLNHERLLEGLWAYHSFLRHADIPAAAIIHDDGSLTAGDIEDIQRVLPGARVVTRAESDAVVGSYFAQHGLARCARLRALLPFSLKLFDLRFFGRNSNVILLDSDVLFFAKPSALLDGLATEAKDVPPLYSLDITDNYCLPVGDLEALLGGACIPRFNPGVMRVAKTSVDLERVERHLDHHDFWPNGRPNYYAELSLWAMELTILGARPLPSGYDIAPGNLGDPSLVAGHYCGGIRNSHLYYTRALPYANGGLFPDV
jgi:hypothetical protein